MSTLNNILNSLNSGFDSKINTGTIVVVLGFSLILGLYEYFVYKTVSRKGFYNKSFNTTLTVLPILISPIILVLQSNVVVTLGTIGAFAIIRFRTAIKDPTDMIYMLWSIFIGITCGSQQYQLGIATSIFVTVVLVAINNVSFGKNPFIVVVHIDNNMLEEEINNKLNVIAKHVRIKSANYTLDGIDYVYEISGSTREKINNVAKEMKLNKYTIIEYDGDDTL